MITASHLRLRYIAADYLSTNLAWFLFMILRYQWGHEPVTFTSWLQWPMVWGGLVLFPLLMLFLYYLSGYYNSVIGKSRMQELWLTACTAFAGTLTIFFIAIVNDVHDRQIAYTHLLALFGLLFTIVYAARVILTTSVAKLIHSRELQFRTLIVGAGRYAGELAGRIDTLKKSMGFNIQGYIAIPGEQVTMSDRPVYELNQLETLCRQDNIRYLILAPEHTGIEHLSAILNRLYILDLPILMSPDQLPITATHRRLHNIAGEPLINMSGASISASTLNIKRVLDVTASTIALIICSPLMVALAIAIKIDTRGPVIYRQKRVGRHRKEFDILKFRSMQADAEATSGPALSLPGDPRITSIGRFMRKYRLDELPQFWNVIRGDMSLVGPRPEREFFVKQIVERAPAYTLLYQIRPGITSWGMVKYGYAGNVDAMIERLRYDLLYLENMSTIVDLKVLFYTIHTVLTGKGV